MIRVIAGSAGGLKLRTCPDETTRPTLDRVKEAMFSMLSEHLPGASVLDLFSGNGSLGIEALSRGAAHCCFVDKSSVCCEIIRENLAHTHLSEKALVLCGDYSQSLASFRKAERRFDLILLDPPYRRGLERDALLLLGKFRLLQPDCIAAAEHAADDLLEPGYGPFRLWKEKKYGTVRVSLFCADGEERI